MLLRSCLTVCLSLVLACAGCQNSAFTSKASKRPMLNEEELARGATSQKKGRATAEETDEVVTASYDSDEVADEDGADASRRADQVADPAGGAEADRPKTGSGAVSTLLSAAHAASQAGRTAEAKRGYQQVLELDGNHAVAHHRLAVIADNEQDYETAERHYHAALRNAPENYSLQSEMHSDLGYSYILQDKLEEAEYELNRAVELNPTNSIALNNLGLLYGKQQDYDRAMAMFRRGGSSEAVVQANLRKLFPNGPPASSQNVVSGATETASAGQSGNPFAPTPPGSADPLDRSAMPATDGFSAFPGVPSGTVHSAGFGGAPPQNLKSGAVNPRDPTPANAFAAPQTSPAATANLEVTGIPRATPTGISQISAGTPTGAGGMGTSPAFSAAAASASPQSPGSGEHLQAPQLSTSHATRTAAAGGQAPPSTTATDIPWQAGDQSAEISGWQQLPQSQPPVRPASLDEPSAQDGTGPFSEATHALHSTSEAPFATHAGTGATGSSASATLSAAQRDAAFAGMTAGGLFPLSPANPLLPPAGNIEPVSQSELDHAVHSTPQQPGSGGSATHPHPDASWNGASWDNASDRSVPGTSSSEIPSADYGDSTGTVATPQATQDEFGVLDEFNAEVDAINAGINQGGTSLTPAAPLTPYRRQRSATADASNPFEQPQRQ